MLSTKVHRILHFLQFNLISKGLNNIDVRCLDHLHGLSRANRQLQVKLIKELIFQRNQYRNGK